MRNKNITHKKIKYGNLSIDKSIMLRNVKKKETNKIKHFKLI